MSRLSQVQGRKRPAGLSACGLGSEEIKTDGTGGTRRHVVVHCGLEAGKRSALSLLCVVAVRDGLCVVGIGSSGGPTAGGDGLLRGRSGSKRSKDGSLVAVLPSRESGSSPRPPDRLTTTELVSSHWNGKYSQSASLQGEENKRTSVGADDIGADGDREKEHAEER
jgi:hypothetical protein